jgi:hypothetical protein
MVASLLLLGSLRAYCTGFGFLHHFANGWISLRWHFDCDPSIDFPVFVGNLQGEIGYFAFEHFVYVSGQCLA